MGEETATLAGGVGTGKIGAVEPTQVRVGMMDADSRPAEVCTLPARHLGPGERLWRALRKLFTVTGLLLVVGNVLLITFPIPHVHLCLFPLALILGPVLALLAGRERVVFGATALPCPRCRDAAQIPAGLSGWPARFNCERCGIMVELNPAA